MPDFVIVGTDGTEHHFPDGMDPKTAIQVVKNGELKATNQKPLQEPTTFWSGAAKGANDYATELGHGMFESAAHPQTAGDFLGLLLPSMMGSSAAPGLVKGLRSASETRPPVNRAVEAMTPSRPTVVKGLRAVAEPTKLWRKGVGYVADKIEQGGAAERVPKMSEVYSEKPAPPRNPNAPVAPVEPTKISDVVKSVPGAQPYEMRAPGGKTMADVYSEKPAPPRGPDVGPVEPTKISDVVHPVEGAKPYEMGPPDKTMADVYSEGEAPARQPTVPTGPDPMSPRVVGRAPTLDEALKEALMEAGKGEPTQVTTLGETPMPGGSQKPATPAVKGKAPRAGAPGGYTTENPPKGAYGPGAAAADGPVEEAGAIVAPEGVQRSPADRRASPSGKGDRIAETSQGADQLEELLSALHPDEGIPRVNPEGHGTMAEPTGFQATMRSTEPEFTRDVHTGAESGTPEAKSAQAHHKMFGEMDADYRRRIEDPLASFLMAALTGGAGAMLPSRDTTSNLGGLK